MFHGKLTLLKQRLAEKRSESSFRKEVCPDDLLPVETGIISRLPEHVSIGMVRFKEKLKPVWDKWTAWLTGNGIAQNPLFDQSYAAKDMANLTELKNCEAHLTHMLSLSDESRLRNMSINITRDPGFSRAMLCKD